ncbi:MAG TPA: DUF3365 domain-containing protein [Candidatus Wallbacteria bacterium]|nr:DUF3365 domain-containing protein [Candidatus Wallbacteria bacterium]
MSFLIFKNLKIKTILIVSLAILFIIMATVAIFFVQANIRLKCIADAKIQAQRVLDRNLATHEYFSKVLKPAVFKLIEKSVSKDYFDHSWMSSTYVNKEVHKLMTGINPKNSDYYYKECAVNARNPENEADTFEASFIADTNRDKSLILKSEIKEYAGKPYMVFLRRGEVMDESCMRCHSKPEAAPGDMIKSYGSAAGFEKPLGSVISAISIRIPLDAAFAEASVIVKTLSGILVLEFLALFLFIYMIFKYFVIDQIEKFKKKTDLIASNESMLGTMVPESAGFEFNSLADSFNLMSSNLKNLKDTLENRIQDRTAELERLNKTKDKFFSIIAHDLKNQFNYIIGFSDMIKNASEDLSDYEKKQYISYINDSIRSAFHLLSNLLTWSQTQTNAIVFNPEKINLKGLAVKSISEIQPIADQKNIKIFLNADEKIEAELDVNMILTVLRNLLANAVKYSYPGGEVELSAGEKDGAVEISVKDSGTGMSAKFIENLFILGENISKEGTAKERGTGLGLMLCKEFVDKHNGKISVVSEAEKGSTFTFTLPQK